MLHDIVKMYKNKNMNKKINYRKYINNFRTKVYINPSAHRQLVWYGMSFEPSNLEKGVSRNKNLINKLFKR